MKILQVINSLEMGGAEKLLLDTIPLYNKLGIEMDILVLNSRQYPFTAELNKLNCCKIYSYKDYSVYNPIHIFHIIKYVRSYSIIHVHLFPALYWVALAKLLSFSKTPIIFTEHSTNNRRRHILLFKYIDRFIYGIYLKIICITGSVKKNLAKHLSSNIRLITIENGIDINKFSTAESLNRSDFGFTKFDTLLIQVAGFRAAKNQDVVIKALRNLPSNVKTVFVGDGPRREICENLVSELGLNKRVMFLGNRLDIPGLIKMCDISISSSHYEGFGLAAVEAMAASKPVVASDVNGLVHIVRGAGLIFGNSEKTLVDQIKKLLTNREYYLDVAKACRLRANDYDINLMVEKYIALYQNSVDLTY